MAEVKNAFIKSKMNKDLDARLLPSGEYREGINIQISRSEGADVGALQNIRGNKLVIDFAALTGVANLTTIGQFTDPTNEIIYIFLTDYTPPPTNPTAYNPTANNFIYSFNVTSNIATPLVQGAFLNFATTNTIIGVNVLENFLFFTDNRNQPRKINIISAAPIPPATSPTYYTKEEQISVAKYNPYEPIQLYKANNALTPPYETSMYDRTSATTPDGAPNPNFDTNYPGDPNYLNDKFVRFSYRFKFDDNEYSLIAPFTQPAFIPDQDGYFLTNATPTGNSKDENSAYRSTVVEFMENKVDNILLQIPLPSTANVLEDNLKIKEIEILYKESDGTTIKVIDNIDVQTADFKANTTDIVEYNYQARKPFKTLPNADLIRVYDKVPVKAFGQEIISNRVVYSNFQDKHTPPTSLDYSVNASNKSTFNVAGNNETIWDTSIIEYPMHTLKQNRNYQVGIVLSDKFGRSSSVILSSVRAADINEGGSIFKGSTYYHPYKDSANNLPASWPGDSLKVLFNSEITGGGAGLYNGDASSTNYNPLGWYTYKIVVKQTEQEYYNVYLPGILNQDPGGLLDDPKNSVSYITLLNDNINKVPRDLSEVGPEQKQFRSSVQLFGRVTPDNSTSVPAFNEQYYPGQLSDTVSTIGEQDDILGTTGTTYTDVYQSKSNPLLARLTQSNDVNPIGSDISTGTYNILLGIYETTPTISLLDIYWETSTTGLIADLNTAITTGTNQPTGFSTINYSQNEGAALQATITNDFWPLDITDTAIVDSQVNLNTITDGTGVSRTGIIIVRTPKNNVTPNGNTYAYDSYILRTTEYFFFNSNSAKNNFTFNFTVVDSALGTSTLIDFQGSITNNGPLITNCPSSIAVVPGTQDIFQFTGTNGANASSNYTTEGLVWSLTNDDPTSPITINSTGMLQDLTGTATGAFSGTVTLTDADGGTNNGALSVNCPINTTVGAEPANGAFANCSEIIGDKGAVSQGFYWVSNTTNAAQQTAAIDALRQPVAALTLDDNLAAPLSKNLTVTDVSCKKLIDAAPVITNKNTNIIYQNNQALSSLTQGTAYISVDFELQQYSAPNLAQAPGQGSNPSGAQWPEGPYVLWAAFLEYRVNSSSPWVRATDIEGNAIAFGGQQEVNYDSATVYAGFPNIYSSNTGTHTINKEGVIVDYQASDPLKAGNFLNISAQDVMTVTTQYFGAGAVKQYGSLYGKANRTFVVGKDQGYKQNPSKFGDYRLIVSYPYGQAEYYNGYPIGNTSQGVVTINLNNINPAANNVRCPETTSVFYNQNKYFITVKYGDFYYPKDYPTCPSAPPAFFEYKVSSSGKSSAFSALAGATPTITLYAKEWHAKYVTQFYTDSSLSTKWNPNQITSGKWHVYSPAFNATKTGRDGTWNSWVRSPGQEITNFTDFTDENRRWVAEFDQATGKKILRSAFPSSTG